MPGGAGWACTLRAGMSADNATVNERRPSVRKGGAVFHGACAGYLTMCSTVPSGNFPCERYCPM